MVFHHKRIFNDLAVIVLLAMACFVTGKLGISFVAPPAYVSPVWPPAGIALAFLLVFGYRVWPGILLGAVLLQVNFSVISFQPALLGGELFGGLLAGPGPVAQGLLAFYLVKRFTDYPDCFGRAEQLLRFALLVGVSAIIGASFTTIFLYNGGLIDKTQLFNTWLIGWAGEVMGVIIFTPVALVALKIFNLNQKKHFQAAAAFLVFAIAAILMLFYSDSVANENILKTLFLGLGLFFICFMGIINLVTADKNKLYEKLLAERTEDLEQYHMFVDHYSKAANIGGWEYNVVKDRLTWTEQAYRIHELSPDIPMTRERAMSFNSKEARQAINLAIVKAFETGVGWDVEYDMVTAKGTPRRLRSTSNVTIENGLLVKVYGSMQDISEQYNMVKEQEKLITQLQQSHKMEAVGQLAGGMSHEFNNMLQVMLGYVQLAISEYSDDQPNHLKQYLRQIGMAGERAKELVSQILTFSKANINSAEILDPSIIIEETLMMLMPAMPSTLQLHFEHREEIPKIMADKTQFRQILVNLCINARDAVGSKGAVTLDVHRTTKEGAHCSSCHETFSGDYVEISIKDNGYGIPADIQAKIFEPFFTTKELGKSTGMGLPVVHGIVHEYGGHIEMTSSDTEGTEFKILFPYKSEEQLARDLPQQQEISSIGRVANILLVDDEKILTDMLGSALHKSGHLVKAFNNSVEALNYYHRFHGEIDIVITDQTMPMMTGTEMTKSMLAIDSEKKIILYTGYSHEIDERKSFELGMKAFLRKPVDINSLLDIIDTLMSNVKEAPRRPSFVF